MELEWPGKKGVVQSRQGRARSRRSRACSGPAHPGRRRLGLLLARIPIRQDRGRAGARGRRRSPSGQGPPRSRSAGKSSRWVRATYFAGAGNGDHRADQAQRLARDQARAAPEQGKVEVGDKIRVVGDPARQVPERPQGLLLRLAARTIRRSSPATPPARAAAPRPASRPRTPVRVRFYAKVPNQRDYPTSTGARRASACAWFPSAGRTADQTRAGRTDPARTLRVALSR